jgi:hypothetical protein
MKRSNSRSVERSVLINGGRVATTANPGSADNRSRTIKRTAPRRSNRANEYPAGTIGNNIEERNYIQYLIERYHRARRTEFNSGGRGTARFSYATIFSNVERKFGVPTYFVPQARFDELVKYLQQRISGTVLGKSNISRGIRNYASREEIAAEQQPER